MTQALAPIHAVEIVEVGPRDGFQPIGPFIPTTQKLAFVNGAAEAGLRRIEIGSFVSARAIPQLADTPELLKRIAAEERLLPQVLVPTFRRGVEALAAGAPMIAFVLSVSQAHNRNNVRQSPLESADAYGELMQATPADIPVRLNLATSMDCPFDGRVQPDDVLALLERLVPMRPDAEICLCDTTGRAAPAASAHPARSRRCGGLRGVTVCSPPTACSPPPARPRAAQRPAGPARPTPS